MSSCILYQNSSATITLLDIPRSIELAQGCFSPAKCPRLISSTPLEYPYPSIEPKSTKARAKLGETSLEDLLLRKHLELALEEMKAGYDGLWCLPRIIFENKDGNLEEINGRKRQKLDDAERTPTSPLEVQDDHKVLPDDCIHFHNSNKASLNAILAPGKGKAIIPPKSTFLRGEIHETLGTFKNSAPIFDCIVADPPWPNRSARRKQSYSISYGNSEVRSLLSSIPTCDYLQGEGLVAVWVTNKPAFREMLVGEGGLFEEWGVQLVEEWIWLKVTSSGEPICALDSIWRKPYEVLLVGRRCGEKRGDVKRRVIIGVPDLHSRKPNLKVLLEHLVGKKADEYEALEIFARNLTAGWWSMGNEVLKFQTSEHWAEP
jgi:N6-adenosine-specific RNA methylase IME4